MNFKIVIMLMQSIQLINGDFFSDLDKMDVDSQLLEIDKMLKTIDSDEDEAMNKLVDEDQGDDDIDVDDALGALTDLLGGGVCKYKCTNGNKPTPRKGHTPSSNGCGSFGIKIDIVDLPGVEKCCDKHDHCYDTCNSARETCDKAFKDCLHSVCKRIKKPPKTTTKDCKAGADIMYGGAATLGCQAFQDAQEKACTCDAPEKDKPKPRPPVRKIVPKEDSKPTVKKEVPTKKASPKVASSKPKDVNKSDKKIEPLKKKAKKVNHKDEL